MVGNGKIRVDISDLNGVEKRFPLLHCLRGIQLITAGKTLSRNLSSRDRGRSHNAHKEVGTKNQFITFTGPAP